MDEGRRLERRRASRSRSTATRRCSTYTNSDAASLTWQDAGKLVADGKAAFNIMGDWQDGYFSGTKAGGNLALKPNVDYGWRPCPGTDGSTTGSPTASRCRRAPRTAPPPSSGWRFLGSKKAQDTFNPVKGSIPARQDANAKLYGPYLKWALKQWKTDTLAGSLTHGVVRRTTPGTRTSTRRSGCSCRTRTWRSSSGARRRQRRSTRT